MTDFSIPLGDYCYEVLLVGSVSGVINIKLCPYWYRIPTKRNQEDGYCKFLDLGDWEEDGHGLLWDMVKECNINIGDEYA